MRLINADELMEHVWRDKLDSRELIAKMIDNAPTVKEITTNIPISVFEKLISQELKWIPVSERLPKENGWYQCTVDLNDSPPQTIELFYENGKWIQELISTEFDWTENVIAWQPITEPYKEERED